MVGPRAEAGLGCRPGIAASSEQRRLHTTRLRDARGIPATISTMLSTTSPVTAPPKISVILAAGQPSGCRPTTDRGL
jgi:hypothetical protein